MRYYKSLLSIVIRYEIAKAKVNCAKCVASTAMWMYRHHIISEHTAKLIFWNAITYAEHVVERHRNKSH